MGLDAQVIAIGPFSESVLPALEYGNLYAGVKPGAIVITNVFFAENSSDSHELASAFNVGAMDLGNHMLCAKAANIALLSQLFGEKNVAQFQLLASHGFNFYYLPNA